MTNERGHVLVVDDDADVRDALQSVLEERGFSVRTASGGACALESLNREPAALVLLDLMMPGMSGTDLLERMHNDDRLKTIPVVIASAWPEQAKAPTGVQGIVSKPFDLDCLVEVVTRFCREEAEQARGGEVCGLR